MVQTKLFSDLYPAKFLDTLTKLFFDDKALRSIAIMRIELQRSRWCNVSQNVIS